MHRILQTNFTDIQQICQTRNVLQLYSFGSVNTERFNAESDVDFIVEFGEMPMELYADNYFDFCDDLEHLLKRKVDVVTVKSIKNPYFKKEVDITKQLIYETARERAN
jgi:predicted nucleotidyltransferase